MDAKRIVAYVLMGSALGLVFFVFFLLTTSGEEGDESTIWARGASFTGIISGISDERVSLEIAAGDVRDFRLDGGTRWVMTRNRALEVGARVRVIYREVRGGASGYYVARKIVAIPEVGASPEVSASPRPGVSPSVAPSALSSPAPSSPLVSPSGAR